MEACLLLSGLTQPNGLAYDNATGILYAAEVRRIQRQGCGGGLARDLLAVDI